MTRAVARSLALGVAALLALVTVGYGSTLGCRPTLAPSPAESAQPADAASEAAADAVPDEPDTAGDPLMRCPPELTAARHGGADADRYVVPSPEAREALRGAVRELLGATARRDVARELAARAGFEVVDVAGAPDLVVMRERDDARRGGGAYLLRIGGRSDLVVQAPHTFFDQGTLRLACSLFGVANARALFVDTAHRYRSAATDDSGRYPADVAHADDSSFQAATRGALEERSLRRFVQVHGFADREEGAAAVVSTGVATRGEPLLTAVATGLAAALGAPVHRFPDDTSQLGATTNVQGAAVRSAGARFLHVELSATTRDRLRDDGKLRREVLQTLASLFAAE